MATHIAQQSGRLQSQRPRPNMHRVRERGSQKGSPRRERAQHNPSCFNNLNPPYVLIAPGPMEYPRDCLSDTKAVKGAFLCILFAITRDLKQPHTQDDAEETNGDWTTPPSPPPEDRLPKRSKLDDLFESSSPITITRPPPNTQFRGGPPPPSAIPSSDSVRQLEAQMEQARVAARLERKKAEMAAIIAAAAAAQQAEEQRALLEAAAAAEARCKEEERIAEKERRKREKKEREVGGGAGGRRAAGAADGGGDNREKRLLKLVGAVVVKTMSKYRARMDVDTFKKHAKEVRGNAPLVFTSFTNTTQLTHIIAEKEKKSSSFKENKLDALSDEKKAKIKKFAREYVHKILHRLERKRTGGGRPTATAATDSAGTTTPVTPQRADGIMPPPLDDEVDMSVDGDDDDDDDDDEAAAAAMDLSADEEEDDEPTPVDVEPAESDTSTAVAAPADPRLRLRAASAAAALDGAAKIQTKEWDLLDVS
jgi:hypothetical protein